MSQPASFSSGYRFLQLVYLRGIDSVTWPVVEQAGLWGGDEPPDFDEAAAAHHHLFGMNLFPHAALYLQADGLVGGETADRTARLLDNLGVPAPPASVSPDHLAVYLGGLAFLCGAEEDAVADDRLQIAAQIRDRQQRLLWEGILPWVWPFLAALMIQENAFYRNIGSLTAELIAAHAAPGGKLPASPAAQTADDLLAREATGLREIAHFLLTPAYSGWFLTRSVVEAVARALDVPRGFGGREQTLVNLLRTAGQYDLIERVLDEFGHRLSQWADQYAGWAGNFESVLPAVELWERRLAQTSVLLRQMRPLIAQISDGP